MMNKMMMLAGVVLVSSLLAACGAKKAEDAPAADAPAAEAAMEAAPEATTDAAPAADAMAPAAEGAAPAESDDRGNPSSRGVQSSAVQSAEPAPDAPK